MTWRIAALLGLIGCGFCSTALAQGRRGPATRQTDVQRHFGDIATTELSIATDISPDLNKTAVLAAMVKVADWQLPRAQPYYSFEWTEGPLYSGYLVTSDLTGDPKYKDSIIDFGKKNSWQINPNAMVPNANDQCIGQAFVDLYLQLGDKKMLYPTELGLDYALMGNDFYNQGGLGAGGFGAGGFGAPGGAAGGGRGRGGAATQPDNTNPDGLEWWWSDALYMGPATWMRVYKATHENPKYLNYMDKQWWITSDHLYDTTEHLYFRDNSFKTKHEANGAKMFWARGDGWVMGAFPRVIPFLPADFHDRDKFINQFKEMSARLIQIQGSDGLWRAGMLDPDAYDLPETSGSALIIYGLAWGVNAGILDPAVYRPAVAKGWAGLLSHVYEDGRLGCVQQTGSGPDKFPATASYVYGVGAYLLAGSEIYQMSK
jgi:unsaturated rhamnogalacturonyl hydrolase